MQCTKCGNDNREGRKFCAKCAAPLARLFQKCGTANEPEEDFCGECAAPLAASAAAATTSPAKHSNVSPVRIAEMPAPENLDGERKTVTALFADIKGSTELMEDLDPEEARAIIDPALKLMIDAAHRYDGYVVQSTGDGIFALFGAPLAHEDHPQRALYAVLRMQEELNRYSAEVVAGGGSPIQGRIGINTGEVVVRSITTGVGQTEYTPIGHTTNLASRMQTAAPVGSIAVSEATRRLCEGYFILKPLGATRVKGVSEPVNVYEVTGLGPLRTRLQRSAGRGLTKFVGREREMEAMRVAAERAISGHGQIVAAMAEAGTGKSRLYFEFKATSQSGWMVLETFSVSHGKASAYLPVLDLLHGYFKIAGGDDERTRREKVNGKVLTLDRTLEDTVPYLFSLLRIVEGEDPPVQMDGQIRKRRTLEAIKRILLRESLNQPLMVIFEDLHWIDEATQELLNLLVDSIGTAKILLLVNYRPEYSHGWSSKTYYTQLRLDPLGKESAEEMLVALLGDGKDLVALKRLIVARSEGTPFFMEEIVHALFEDGVLQRNGTVKLIKSMNEVKVPATVQGVLAARIDRLAPDGKELLQSLAVIGREFPFGLVRRVTRKPDDDLNRMLSDLQLAEFIYEQPAVGDTEYIFKHALTQEVAYNSLLVERRRQLHERAAGALESLFAAQLDDHLDQLAHHYSRTDNVEKAVEYLGRAGQQAAQRSAYVDGIRNLTTAIDLLQKLPDNPGRAQRELQLQLALGPVSTALKGFCALETERAFNRARQLCERLGDSQELIPTLIGLWLVHVGRGEARKAYELAEEIVMHSRGTSDPTILLRADWVIGCASYFIGDLLSAKKHLELALARRPAACAHGSFETGIVDRQYTVWTLQYASWTLWHLGYPVQALERANEGLALARGMSHPFSLAIAELTVGFVHQYRREAGLAQATAERSIGHCTEHGITDYLAFAISLRGWAITAHDRNNDEIGLILEGMAASRSTGAEAFRPYYLSLLAERYMETGNLDKGLSALNEALAATDENEQRYYKAEIHRLKGELLLRKNNSTAAEGQRCFERAIEVARKQSGKSFELRATTSLARLLASQGHREDARAKLADIYNWFTEGFDTADLIEAKALLDELNSQS